MPISLGTNNRRGFTGTYQQQAQKGCSRPTRWGNVRFEALSILRRDVNKAFVEVTGEKVNRGAGYGLEIPCIYRLYGPTIYICRMKELIDSLIITETRSPSIASHPSMIVRGVACEQLQLGVASWPFPEIFLY